MLRNFVTRGLQTPFTNSAPAVFTSSSISTHVSFSSSSSSTHENESESESTNNPVYGSPEWKSEVLNDALTAFLHSQPKPTTWEATPLSDALEKRGVSVSSSGLFPLGAEKEMIHAWMESSARATSAWARDEQGPVSSTKSITTKLFLMTQHRLQASAALGPALLKSTFRYSLEPDALPRTLEITGMMVDELWNLAGDKATDYNWYTKRGLLSAVYIATELFMLTDTSPGHAETWAFLERRLKDVGLVGRDLGKAVGVVIDTFNQVYTAGQALAPVQTLASNIIQVLMAQAAQATGNAAPTTAPGAGAGVGAKAGPPLTSHPPTSPPSSHTSSK